MIFNSFTSYAVFVLIIAVLYVLSLLFEDKLEQAAEYIKRVTKKEPPEQP